MRRVRSLVDIEPDDEGAECVGVGPEVGAPGGLGVERQNPRQQATDQQGYAQGHFGEGGPQKLPERREIVRAVVLGEENRILWGHVGRSVSGLELLRAGVGLKHSGFRTSG